jgi:hypothetical protein
MAASLSALYVKRADLELKDDLEVHLTCAVQMFDFKNGKPVWTEKFFPAGAKVKLKVKESQQALASGFKFYYVQAGTTSGYMPKSAFHDFVAAEFGSSIYTGVSYGGDKWLKDGQGNFHSFPIDDEGICACHRCGRKANDHKLYETKDLATLLSKLNDLLRGCWDKKTLTTSGFMLGAIQTKEGGYAVAYSGNIGIDNAAVFEKCAAQLDQKTALAPPLSGTRYLSDNKTPQKYPRKLLGNWTCAAPRLVQWAWRDGQTPLYMSEKWFGPKLGETAINKHTIKSCDDCRLELPYMLCGLAARRNGK